MGSIIAYRRPGSKLARAVLDAPPGGLPQAILADYARPKEPEVMPPKVMPPVAAYKRPQGVEPLATADPPEPAVYSRPPDVTPPLPEYRPEEIPLPEEVSYTRPLNAEPRPYVGKVGFDVGPRNAGLGVRDRIADPLNYARKRLEQAEATGVQARGNSRGRSALEGMGRGALRGGPLGALVGLVSHALDPSLDEKFEHGQMMGRDRARVGNLLQLGKADSELEAEQSASVYRRAQAQDLADKPRRDAEEAEAKARDSAADRLVRIYNDLPEFDPTSPDDYAAALVREAAVLGVPLPKKDRNLPAPHFDYDGDGNLVSVSGGVATIIRDPRGKPFRNPSKANVPVTIEGQTFSVPQVEGVRAKAAAGQHVYRRKRDESQDAQEEAERVRRAAGEAAADIEQLNTLRRQAEGARTQRERESYAAEARRVGELILSRHGGRVELDEGGWPVRVKSAPAPSRKYTEEEIRRAARENKKDEGEAVRKARAAGWLQ
jgi:hypothetical protein